MLLLLAGVVAVTAAGQDVHLTVVVHLQLPVNRVMTQLLKLKRKIIGIILHFKLKYFSVLMAILQYQRPCKLSIYT